jgi:hypothetical protein
MEAGKLERIIIHATRLLVRATEFDAVSDNDSGAAARAFTCYNRGLHFWEMVLSANPSYMAIMLPTLTDYASRRSALAASKDHRVESLSDATLLKH